jgi:hypothetical protein
MQSIRRTMDGKVLQFIGDYHQSIDGHHQWYLQVLSMFHRLGTRQVQTRCSLLRMTTDSKTFSTNPGSRPSHWKLEISDTPYKETLQYLVNVCPWWRQGWKELTSICNLIITDWPPSATPEFLTQTQWFQNISR